MITFLSESDICLNYKCIPQQYVVSLYNCLYNSTTPIYNFYIIIKTYITFYLELIYSRLVNSILFICAQRRTLVH
jgi:hypothetical protein